MNQPESHAMTPHLETLLQGARLLRGLDPAEYRRPSELLPGGSIGAHVRHCLDFYSCFLSGLDEGRVDYDLRERERSLEEDPLLAATRIEETARALERFSEDRLPAEIRVRGDGPNPGEGWTRSSPGRELHFLRGHTIHHYALVGAVLRARGQHPDPTFGVAPSTLRHWETGGARA